MACEEDANPTTRDCVFSKQYSDMMILKEPVEDKCHEILATGHLMAHTPPLVRDIRAGGEG